jgi:hypothetical protein
MDEIGSVLTIKEIAVILRCSRTHVTNLLGGRVAGVKPLVHLSIGRRKIVRRQSFDQWLNANEVHLEPGDSSAPMKT